MSCIIVNHTDNMKCLYAVVCAIFLVMCLVAHARADISTCTFKNPATGKVYDFSTLINPSGYYSFNTTVWSIGGFSLDSLSSDSQVKLTVYVQVCRNLPSPPPGCEDVGALYTMTSDGKCQSWGDANVAIFDPNPYKDGVNIKHYHGTMIDHMSFNSGNLYFVCDTSQRGPMFEHVKAAINQAHFKIFTPLAC